MRDLRSVDVALRHLQLAPDHGGLRASATAPRSRSAQFLPRFASGELRGGLALTEPDCGTDLQAIRTRAVRDGDHYVVNGTKTWITQRHPRARASRCWSRPIPTAAAAPQGHDACSSPRRARASASSRKLEKIGYKGIDSAELIFEDYRVPAADLIGGERARASTAPSAGSSSAASTSPRAARHRQGGARRVGALRAAAQDLRQADRRAPGDPAQARRDGDRASKPRRC